MIRRMVILTIWFVFCTWLAPVTEHAQTQEKPLPSIPIEEVGTNPLITTVHTGFKVGNQVGRAKLVREDWTPTRIEREWIMPLIQGNNWKITEESPRWIEVIVVFEGKLKLTEKRLQKKDYETVTF